MRYESYQELDITGGLIKRFEPETGRFDQWHAPGMPVAFVPRHGGGAVVAVDRRVTLFDFSDRFETLAIPEPDLPGNRLNEAAADPLGRLWIGTMENNIMPDGSPRPIEGRKGSLHVVDPLGTCGRASDHLYGITNTLVWSGDTFITADTTMGEIYAFDFDAGWARSQIGACSRPNLADRMAPASIMTDTSGMPGSATHA